MLPSASLTEMQAAFVEYVVDGIRPARAAALAGYAHPDQLAHQLQRKPAVQRAIQTETTRRLRLAAGGALSVLVEIAHDGEAPKGVRVDAAKAILDRAGHSGRSVDAGSAVSEALNELSIEELHALVQTIAAERAAAATVVEPADSQDAESILD